MISRQTLCAWDGDGSYLRLNPAVSETAATGTRRMIVVPGWTDRDAGLKPGAYMLSACLWVDTG